MSRIIDLVRKLELRLNRPLLPGETDASFATDWSEGSETLTRLLSEEPVDLLIAITTFRRPGECARLLGQLKRELAESAGRIVVVVQNDASSTDYAEAKLALEEAFGTMGCWLDATRNLGKREFWRTHQMQFLVAEASRARALLSLQDDLELARGFFSKLRTLWDGTSDDPKRRVINLFSGHDDEPDGRWVRFARRDVPGLPARRTDWFDMAGYYADREFLRLMRYWVSPVPLSRWKVDPNVSSGVGRQLTLRLNGRGHVYQAYPPLLAHGGVESQMNLAVRGERDFDNRSLFAENDEKADEKA